MGATKQAETLQAISSTALALFTRDGYDRTTVDAIARAAGVSRATVFRYFPSKEEIVFARYPAEIERLRSALRASGNADEAQSLRRVLLDLARRFEADEGFGVEVTLMAAHPRLLGRALVTLHVWAELLAADLAAVRGRPTVNLRRRVLAHAATSALQEAICIWRTAEPGTSSLVRLAGDALSVALPARPRS